MKLIGITGLARSGKDTIAKHLWTRYEFTRIALADPLKLAAQQAFGLTQAQLGDELKDVVIPYWGIAPRQMYQQIGDSFKEKFGEDFWVKRWRLSYGHFMDTDHVVVPDVRFDNEVNEIRSLNGVLIRVVRGRGLEGAAGQHKSEAGITLPVNYTIDNPGSVSDMHAEVDRIVRSLA